MTDVVFAVFTFLHNGRIVLKGYIAVIRSVAADVITVGILVHSVLGGIAGTQGLIGVVPVVCDPDLIFGADGINGQLGGFVVTGIYTGQVSRRCHGITEGQADIFGRGGAKTVLRRILIVKIDGVLKGLSLDPLEHIVRIGLGTGHRSSVSVIVGTDGFQCRIQTGIGTAAGGIILGRKGIGGSRNRTGIAVNSVIAAVLAAQFRGSIIRPLQLRWRLLRDLDLSQIAAAVIGQVRDQHYMTHIIGIQAVAKLQLSSVGCRCHADVCNPGSQGNGICSLPVDAQHQETKAEQSVA